MRRPFTSQSRPARSILRYGLFRSQPNSATGVHPSLSAFLAHSSINSPQSSLNRSHARWRHIARWSRGIEPCKTFRPRARCCAVMLNICRAFLMHVAPNIAARKQGKQFGLVLPHFGQQVIGRLTLGPEPQLVSGRLNMKAMLLGTLQEIKGDAHSSSPHVSGCRAVTPSQSLFFNKLTISTAVTSGCSVTAPFSLKHIGFVDL